MAYRALRGLLGAVILAVTFARAAAAQRGVIKANTVDSASQSSVQTTAILEGNGVKQTSTGDGRISFSSLSAGSYQLTVRAIGYAPIKLRIQLARNDTVSGTLKMVRLLETLDTVAVRAIPPGYGRLLEEFESRRAVGLGRFLDWNFFQKRRDRSLGSALEGMIPGLKIQRIGIKETPVTKRNGSLCVPQGVVNGMIFDELDLSLISTDAVLGFEFYTPATTPPRYNRTGNGIFGPQCGTVVLWTK